MGLTPYLYPEIKLFTVKTLKQIQYIVREYYPYYYTGKTSTVYSVYGHFRCRKVFYLTSMLNSLNYYLVQ
jgi:hypothetical protein